MREKLDGEETQERLLCIGNIQKQNNGLVNTFKITESLLVHFTDSDSLKGINFKT